MQQLLIYPPFVLKNVHDEVALKAEFVNFIMEYSDDKDDNPKDDNETEFFKLTNNNADKQLKFLKELFPDVDPTHLQEIAKQNDTSIEDFIHTNLTQSTYPKASLEKEKLHQVCTTEFDVHKFLANVPQPFEYFEDASKENVFNPKALDFLHNSFRKIKVNFDC